MTSRRFREALEAEARARAEFRDYRHMAYQRAHEATNGHMLNQRGQDARIDSRDLYERGPAFVNAYASEELREHLARFPRMSWPEWERWAYEPL